MTDMGDRFRIVANVIDVVEADRGAASAARSRGPSGGRDPTCRTAVEAWLTAGGAHHTVLTRAIDPEPLVDFAEMAGVELLLIDEDVDAAGVPERAPLEPGLPPPGPRPVAGPMSDPGSQRLREAVWRANQALVRGGPGDAVVRQRQRRRPRPGT